MPGFLSKNQQENQKPVIRVTDGLYSTGIYFRKKKKLKDLLPNDGYVYVTKNAVFGL